MSEADKPLVSVVMPVYNGERFLAEAIESILAQTLADFELIIVDDGSSDGSAAIARDYAKGDERIRHIQHERSQGSASARNSGIAASSGEFIAAMDCDDISLPQRLEKQVDFLQSRADIGVVGTSVQSAFGGMTRFHNHVYPQHHALIVLLWVFGRTTVAGPTIMARRNVLISVGGYEGARRITDDKELFSRLYAKTRFANVSKAHYLYRRHENQKSVKLRTEQQNEGLAIRQRWLARLWVGASPVALETLERAHEGAKLGWRERRRLRHDLARLIDAMVAANILLASDLPLIEAEVNRRLESTMPRRWQMLLHWRRHRFIR